MGIGEVNKDLIKERAKCTFNVTELTYFLDGGKDKTLERKERERVMLTKREELFGGTPDEYLSHKEKYENSTRKAVILFSLLRKIQEENNTDLTNYRNLLSGVLGASISQDGSPFGLHYIMFMPVFMSQADEEQQERWLHRALNCSIIGSYAQTELGHGTFIRGLETTATYDPSTQEFVLHSPTLTSYKWWPGGLGNTANYCIVIAQLYSKGECHGIHSFIVQVRDEDTHMPLPGIKVGEIGVKMGLNAVNNGFIGFENVRIPRTNMLMKHAKILEDGTYVKSKNSKLIYGAMVFVRVVIVFDSVNYLAKAITVATRYSAVRRQSQLKEGEPERQILDYVTQQDKILTAIAGCFAMKMNARMLWDTFNVINDQLHKGNMERLGELHALACCLKAISTSDSSLFTARCRVSCGGHGYMVSSTLPATSALTTASCTYEGDNTVLLLQTARFLLKTWRQIDTGPLTPTVEYLKTVSAPGFSYKWENSIEGIIRGFQIVSMKKISSCLNLMTAKVMSGMSQADAWNTISIQLVSAGESHCRAIVISTFHEDMSKAMRSMSASLAEVMGQLVELYAVYWTLERLGDLLEYTSISGADVVKLRSWYEELLRKIRPNAVGLVDAFDIIDELLQSTLGAYDGRVYERLMEEALKSPLNAEPVNQSFHKYLKPFMQGKL
ncbi:probable peroxisomal acyl-coenzyme A oxidase 1 isoform X1 [Spodoptera litura]|uniref:Acyl-coenzyme A oxidase n=2 Tax=Spodoptera litura TaxID=69820 RepID=A0A9J7IQR4_SPOLT|nr:probable peroxisomal acyl-coenzyme A oxidase 1 isoform X1 [Spodoptera litura]